MTHSKFFKPAKVLKFGLVAMATLPLSACVTLQSDTPPPAIYRMEAASVNSPAIPLDVQAPTVLLVNEPAMPAGFKSDEIILHFDAGRRQDRYAGAFWSDDLSDLIREYVIAHGRSTYPDLVLDRAEFGLSPDYTLNIDVLDFQPVYEGQPSGVPVLKTRLRFALMNSKTNALLADLILERSAPASTDNLTAITAGLESQLSDILAEAFDTMAPQIR